MYKPRYYQSLVPDFIRLHLAAAADVPSTLKAIFKVLPVKYAKLEYIFMRLTVY